MKLKTFITLVLTGMLGLGSCAKAQQGKQVIDLDNPDYNLDVAHYYSESTDVCNSSVGKGSTGVSYEKDTIMTYGENPRPMMVFFYNKESGPLYKEATLCGFEFGKLDMAVNMQGKLIHIRGKAETDEEGFDRMMEAVVRKYGEPVNKSMKTGKENIDRIVAEALKENTAYHWDVGDDEYIEIVANRSGDSLEDEEDGPMQAETTSSRVEVIVIRSKKEFDRQNDELLSPLFEEIEGLIKSLNELERESQKVLEYFQNAISEEKE